MKYPIDVEKYIAAMRLEFGFNENAEKMHRVIVPLVNACYEDGLRGENGYPLDPEKKIQAFAEASGIDLEHIKKNPLLLPLTAWCNRAYFQGRNDAKEATA